MHNYKILNFSFSLRSCVMFVSCILLSFLNAGPVVWSPVCGVSGSAGLEVSRIAQVRSEVYMMLPIQQAQVSCTMATVPVDIDCPSLFLVDAVFLAPGVVDTYIYNSGQTLPYRYDLGDGWIYHRKLDNVLVPSEASFGWLYIREYPWVYCLRGGWRYFIEDGVVNFSNAWWFYEPGKGWSWTTRNLYPLVFSAGTGWRELAYP